MYSYISSMGLMIVLQEACNWLFNFS